MSRTPRIEAVAPTRRRRFIQAVSAALAAPFVPAGFRFAMNEELFGTAHAYSVSDFVPSYLIEINLRDQWDFGHVFVPPSLATNPSLIRGPDGNKCSLFWTQADISSHGNGFYLTPDSMALQPHLDSIAVCESNELCVGAIHGHEAVNAMRSPGRDKQQTGDKMPVWENEPGFSEQGNDYFYSTTPTPASLHNYVQKQIDPTLRNGITMKFISRFHTVCHFAGTKSEGELTRIQSVQQLYDTFPDTVEDLNVLPTTDEARVLSEALKRVDKGFFAKHGYRNKARNDHESNLAEAEILWHTGDSRLVSMPLTEEEVGYWSADVPDQVGDNIKAQIWEQAAWAFKLIGNDVTRSVSLEFDYLDVHDTRPDYVMHTMGLQASLPLSRLIESLKAAGIYDQTLIVVYSTDGGRAPSANSYGNTGKNTFVLAGRGVRGGYYGDVSVTGNSGDGHSYGYHVPDDAGAPQAPVGDNSNRLEGARSWRTVMRALDMPDDLCDEFADVAGKQPLNFMLG
jgi:hypothetical protein